MFVHKLVFFCWLVATYFGETETNLVDTIGASNAILSSPSDSTNQTSGNTTSTSEPIDPGATPTTSSAPNVTEGSNGTHTVPPNSTDQTPENVTTPSKPIETTAPTLTTPSAPNVTESSNGTHTLPPDSTDQTPENVTTTSKPTEPGATPTTPSAPNVTEGSNGTNTLPPDSTDKTPENVTTTSKPTEPGATPTTTSAPNVTEGSNGTNTLPPVFTTTSNVSSGTEPPNKTTPVKPTVPSTPKPPACSSSPCPFDSICVELFDGFTCQCYAGSFLSEGSCQKAKVFAGNLRLNATPFEDGMLNTGSEIFQKTAKEIQTALAEALRSDSYVESVVLKLSEGSIIATVDNIYKTTSNMTEASFTSTLKDSIEQCGTNCGILQKAEFKSVDLCDQESAPCDLNTTTCESSDGEWSCPCTSDYVKSTFSSRSCSACPNGEKADKGVCIDCSFGYSGFNCNDSSLLAVVVISCVLGGLLLITLAVVIHGCRTKPKDYSSPYPPAPETRSTWTNGNVPKIPRATANINAQWDPSNLEMMESGSTRALVGKERPGNGVMGPYGDMRTFTGNNPSRYYADHGRDNPRFMADDERGTR